MAERDATPATILAALKASAPGDIIHLAGGVTTPVWPGVRFDGPGVTIKAAEGAELTGWGVLKDCAGITLDGFKIIGTSAAAAIGMGSPTTERVVLENCEFTAAPGITGAGAGSIGSGVVVRKAWVHDISGGLQVAGRNTVVEDSLFERIAGDAMAVAPPTDAVVAIRRNVVRHSTKQDTVHLDGVQLIAGVPYTVYIEDNLIDSREGTPMQGIFTDNGGMIAIIRRNAILGSAWHGISLNNPLAGSILEDNFIQGCNRTYGTLVNMLPWIRIVGQSPGGEVLVSRNAAGSFNCSNASVRQSENVTIKNAAPGDETDYLAWRAKFSGPSAPAPTAPPKTADQRLAEMQAALDAEKARTAELTAALAESERLRAEAPPAPDPVPVEPTPDPEPDTRDDQIAAMTAAGLAVVDGLTARAETAEAALAAILPIAKAGTTVTSALKAKPLFQQIVALAQPAA